MVQETCQKVPPKASLKKLELNNRVMKKLNVVIEQGEDAFFAYVEEIDGCTAGGYSYDEAKINIQQMIQLALTEDEALRIKYASGYDLIYKLSMESGI